MHEKNIKDRIRVQGREKVIGTGEKKLQKRRPRKDGGAGTGRWECGAEKDMRGRGEKEKSFFFSFSFLQKNVTYQLKMSHKKKK